jgi:hypothetical protein
VGDPAWNHIWLEVAGPRGWVTLDDTMKGWMNGPGWSPSGAYGALVAEQRPGYAPPMQPVPVERRALYGGCAALQDGLGKFKLKVPKVVKRVANLVALPVTAPLALATGRGPAAHYVPAPLRDVLKKISGVTLPLASSATNLIVPGAGAITSVITDQVLRDQSPPTMTPAPVPVSLPQIGPPPVSYGPGGPTGGGSSAMSFAPDPQGADAQGTVSPKKKMALSDGAVYGVLALTGLAAWFLLRRRRRR